MSKQEEKFDSDSDSETDLANAANSARWDAIRHHPDCPQIQATGAWVVRNIKSGKEFLCTSDWSLSELRAKYPKHNFDIRRQMTAADSKAHADAVWAFLAQYFADNPDSADNADDTEMK